MAEINGGVGMAMVAALAAALGRDPAVIAEAVAAWLDEHPEATTTVEDGSITYAKLAEAVQEKLDEIEGLSEAIVPLETAMSEQTETDIDISSGFVPLKSINCGVGVGNTVSLTPNDSGTYGYIIDDCVAGTDYIVKGVGGGNARLWAFIDASNKLLSASETYAIGNYITVSAPNGAAKAIFNMEKDALHIVTKKGTMNTLINVSDINDAFVDSPQMFDRNVLTAGKKYSDGAIVDDEKYYLSDYIPIEPNTPYTYRAVVGLLVYFGSSKEYLSAVSVEINGTAETKTSPENASFVRLQLQRIYYPFAVTSMGKGSSAVNTVDLGKLLIPGQILKPSYEFSPLPIPTEYSAIGTKAVDGSAGTDFDDDNPSLTDLYDAYDELVELYPDYVTKEDLGTDQSGTYHIYAYHFTPEEPEEQHTYYRKPCPKVNLLSGIHGNGNTGDSNVNCFCLYYLMKSLCDSWRQSEALTYLRWNVRFAVVPVQNPWGFVNKSRQNSRGVDICSNFNVGWSSGDPGDANYGGSAPMSEAETVIIANFGEANKDAIFSTDLHSQGNVPTQSTMVYTSVDPTCDMFYVAKAIVQKMSNLWDSKNIPNLNAMNFHGFINSAINGGGTQKSYMWTHFGIPAMTLEGFKNFTSSSYTDDSAEIVKMVADQLGYYILLGLQYFKDRQ